MAADKKQFGCRRYRTRAQASEASEHRCIASKYTVQYPVASLTRVTILLNLPEDHIGLNLSQQLACIGFIFEPLHLQINLF